MKQKIAAKKREKGEGGKLAKSGAVFLACFLLIVLFVLLILIMDRPADWTHFLAEHYDEEIALLLSLLFLCTIAYFYFFYEDREFLYRPSSIFLFFSLIIVSAVLCYVFGRYVSVYARPYAMFAVLCLFLLGRKHALFLNFIFVFMMFSVDLFTRDFPMTISIEMYSSMLIGFVSGTFAVFFANRTHTRLGLLLTGVFLSVPTVLIIFFLQIPNPDYGWIDHLTSTGFQILGCVASAVLTLALLPFFEFVFNRLTVYRLRELTSTNAALLVRLRDEANGTFTHSLTVAQLAESCAVAIGENAELARAAAYYHDVGKLKQPDCFTENQKDYNLHDELTPELSADIIRSHTKDGYELLVQNHLPKVIADVAREHHGTLPIKFFYDKAIRLAGEADIKDFSYLGPLPQTKISAIIMVADAAEAAVRASSDRSPERVEKVCRSIIEERMNLNQFDECDITMKELTVIKRTLVEALSGVHHHRVEYPNIQFNRDREAVKTEDTDA